MITREQLKKIWYVLAACTSLYYIYAGWFGPIGSYTHLAIIMGVSLLFVYIKYPFGKWGWAKYVDILFAVVAIAVLVAVVRLDFRSKASVIAGFSDLDYVSGVLLMVIVVDACRRVVGWPLTSIGVVAFFYARFGDYFPGFLRHPGSDWLFAVEQISLSGEGIWGIALAVVASTVIVFVIFGSIILESAGAVVFTNLPRILFGRVRGGAAKIAVVGSSLLGTVTGSVVANVVTTGSFTIPMMKKAGYSPTMAGAVETASSCGGQIMPPVMGAAAFVMAELLRVSYWAICVAAFVPALLYYLAVFLVVDFEAGKLGIKPVADDSPSPSLLKVLRQSLVLLVPLAFLMVLLSVFHLSAQKAVIYAIGAVILLGLSDKSTRLTPQRLFSALGKGTEMSVMVAVACALVGIIIGSIQMSGVGVNLSGALVNLAGGNVLVLLSLIAITSIILGLGLTTTPCYIILAYLAAPALVSLGINRMAAHLFILYYGVLSQISPPSALGAYAAAAISGGPAMRTAFTAMRLAVVAYIVPFFFVFKPALILQAPVPEILVACLLAAAGVVGIAAASEGFLMVRTRMLERVLFGVSGVFLFFSVTLVNVVALALLLVTASIHVYRYRAEKKRALLAGGP